MIPRKSAPPTEHKSEPSALFGGVGCGRGGCFPLVWSEQSPPEARGINTHVYTFLFSPLCSQHPQSSPRFPLTRSECQGAWRHLSVRPPAVPSLSSTGTRRARRSTPSVSRWLSQCSMDNHKCMKDKLDIVTESYEFKYEYVGFASLELNWHLKIVIKARVVHVLFILMLYHLTLRVS